MIELGARRTGPEMLALRALKLGDLLVAVPALHGLRRAFPQHRLVLACPEWLLPIVRMIRCEAGGVDALLPAPGLDEPLAIEPGRIEIAVNLHGNGPESARLIAALDAPCVIAHRPHGRPAASAPDWIDGMLERERWARLVRSFGVAADSGDVALAPPDAPSPAPGAAVVHVGAFYGSRRWPIERFAAVAALLAGTGAHVVLTGSAVERERAVHAGRLANLPDAAVLAGRLELDGFAALVHGARVVVTADTSAGHLASAYRTPSVVLFGPAPHQEWGPPAGGPHVALAHPELRRGDAFSEEPDPALLAITVDEVRAALARLGVL